MPGCSTGTVQCCQHVGKKTDHDIGLLLGLLGIVLGGLEGVLGLGCSPILGLGGPKW